MRPVKLFTSKTLSQEEVASLLLQIRVERDESSHRIWDYRIDSGEAIVWVDPDDPEHYPNPEIDALIESKLGVPSKMYIVLHVSSGPGSGQLARDLAIRFAEQVPAVLDNMSALARRIFTLAELQALQAKGAGLWDDERNIPLPREWTTLDDEDRALLQRGKTEERQSGSGFEE